MYVLYHLVLLFHLCLPPSSVRTPYTRHSLFSFTSPSSLSTLSTNLRPHLGQKSHPLVLRLLLTAVGRGPSCLLLLTHVSSHHAHTHVSSDDTATFKSLRNATYRYSSPRSRTEEGVVARREIPGGRRGADARVVEVVVVGRGEGVRGGVAGIVR